MIWVTNVTNPLIFMCIVVAVAVVAVVVVVVVAGSGGVSLPNA